MVNMLIYGLAVRSPTVKPTRTEQPSAFPTRYPTEFIVEIDETVPVTPESCPNMFWPIPCWPIWLWALIILILTCCLCCIIFAWWRRKQKKKEVEDEPANEGKGAFTLPNGDVYEGKFVGDRKHGPGKYSDAHGFNLSHTLAS